MSVLEKIKLVHIISNLNPGGAQIVVFDILKKLKQKNKFEITVITIDGGEYIEKFKKAEIDVIDLKEKGFFNFKILTGLKKILNKINPDIVHTHLLTADVYGRIAAKQTGVKVIYSTCHNCSLDDKSGGKSYLDWIDNFVCFYTNSNLIAVSEAVKNYLLKRKKKLENLTEVIYNGVCIEKENYVLDSDGMIGLRKKYDIKKDDFLITVIGRLEPQKGHIFFLNAVREFILSKDKIKILFAGEGSKKGEIEKLVNETELKGKVVLTGFQQDSEKYIEISDLICVPSLWEGFGLVIVEAMLKKKIVLASNAGAIPELIIDGETGYLFNSENKNNFLEKINFIYNNKGNDSAVKATALNLAKEKFGIENTAHLYFKSYLSKLNTDSGK